MRTLTLVAPLAPPVPCPAWCVDHSDAASGLDICATAMTELDFGDHGPCNVEYASVHMLYSPDEGLNIYLGFGGEGFGMDVEQAEQVANALLKQVALARGTDPQTEPAADRAAQTGGVR